MKSVPHDVLWLVVGVVMLVGCGGGGGGDTRTVTGSVPAAGSQASLGKALKQSDAITCAADTVITTDVSGVATSTAVADDCSFSLSLQVGQAFVVSFVLDGQFVATLVFDSGIDGFSTSSLTLADGGVINLGTIIISGRVATCERNPLEDNDQDGDGEDDFTDQDDNDDGEFDEEEGDCDLDGLLDDSDDDEECEAVDGDQARVLEVKPRNDPHTDRGEDRIDLEREVRARISCEIDQSTVNSQTFRVESDDDVITCAYSFSGTGQSGNRIRCEHDAQDFLPDAVYTATIDGLRCADGRSVVARSWSWLTEEVDDDDGDAEDELDEEEEEESEEEDEDDESEDRD